MSILRAMLWGVDEPETADHASNSLSRLVVADEVQRLILDTHKALGVAAVFRARQMTADALASVPVRAGEQLAPAPNDEQSMSEFVVESALSMMDSGDAYWWRDGSDLRVLPPNEVHVTWDGPVGAGRLRRRVYRWGDRVLRTSGLGRNLWVVSMNRGSQDLTGMGPMQSSRIKGVLAAQAYVEEFFTYNANPSGILKVSGKMTEKEAKALKRQWMENRTKRTPAVLSENYSWESTSFNPSDSEWVETHRISTGDVALLFGLDGSQLNYNTPGSSLTYQSAPDVTESWWRVTLFPYYARRFAEALTDWFGTQVRFDPEALFLADLSTRTRAASALVNAGYDPADAADVAGLPPIRHSGVLPVTVQQEDEGGGI